MKNVKKIKFVDEKKSKVFAVLIPFGTLKTAEDFARDLTYCCDVVEVINDE